MERDQQFLEYVVKALADNPDDVKIRRTVDEMGVLLTLSVNKDDMGKVIGRSGATAKAIRTILRVVGMKNDARVNLKIEEPEGMEEVEAVSTSSEPYVRDTTVDDVIKDLKGEQ
ncbi:MAG TPA: KH domain-containing protein [Candidatus Paceibacterota bacterium]|nr:KH domain-containing protein [Candidatus Paceibacterota bacterium]